MVRPPDGARGTVTGGVNGFITSLRVVVLLRGQEEEWEKRRGQLSVSGEGGGIRKE